MVLFKKQTWLTVGLLLTLTACGGGGGGGSNDTNDAVAPHVLPGLITASRLFDANGDGKLDLVIGSQDGDSPPSDILLLNDGMGNFTRLDGTLPNHYLGSEGATVDFETADFNGDGFTDLLTSTVDSRQETFYQTGQIHLFLGNNDGKFIDASENIQGNLINEPPSGTLVYQWVEQVQAGDFDLDGNMDFIISIAGCGSAPLDCIGGRIYLNDSTGKFAPGIITSTDTPFSTETYAYDKLVWRNYSGGGLRVALELYVGDVNNDGKLDIVAPNAYAAGAYATFINTSTPGNLTFNITYTYQLDKENPPYGTTYIKGGALLDINADGFLDLVGSPSIREPSLIPGETNVNSAPVYAFINQGDGSFVEDNTIFLPLQPGVAHARGWLVDDFNQDGVSDLFVADHGDDYGDYPGYPNLLLLNRSPGMLDDVSTALLGNANTYTHGASSGDVNGDGFPDLFLNNSSTRGGPRLLLNESGTGFSPDDSGL